MYIEDFKQIVTRLEKDFIESEKYLEELRSVDDSVFDMVVHNNYALIFGMQLDFLNLKLFGEELYEWVSWYLYDKGNNSKDINYNGVKYTISDIDSFFLFAEQALNLPMKPRS